MINCRLFFIQIYNICNIQVSVNKIVYYYFLYFFAKTLPHTRPSGFTFYKLMKQYNGDDTTRKNDDER